MNSLNATHDPGAKPLMLPSGEDRQFLLDGDEVRLTGFCERPGYVRIGFGECRAVVLPSSAHTHVESKP